MEYPRDFHRGRQRARRSNEHEWPQHFRRPRQRRARGQLFHGALVVAIVSGVWIGLGGFDLAGFERALPDRAPPTGAPVAALPQVSARFGRCHTGGGTNCVVDGDTFWVGGEKVRVADIDAPETHPPRCAEEARLGAAATLRLQALLNAGPVTLAAADRDVDRYGRKLRVVERGGQSLGMTLVSEGLAREWEGARRPWC